MSYKQVTYHELLTHANNLGIQIVSWDFCTLDNRLGSGASMNVFSGTYEVNGLSQNVAFKFTRDTLTTKTKEKLRSRALMDVRQEIRIMGRLKGHSRIVQLLGVSFNDHVPVLILELAKTNLEYYLQEDERVPWKTKLGFMYDIVLGLAAIHSAEIVHGDLKAANILIYDGDHGRMVAKISDFGYSSTDLSIQAGRKPGFSYHFRSRECFDIELRDWNGKPTTDIYSYGLLVYQIAHDGTIPFEEYDMSEIDNMKKGGTELTVLLKLLPNDTPMEVRNVIVVTVQNIPSKRSSLDEIKKNLIKSEELDKIYSYEEAKIIFESLAQIEPQESIGVSMMNELSIPSSLKKSIFLEYQRLSDAGDVTSQARLGSCWLLGFGTQKDNLKAVECFTKAAEAGNAYAQCKLGFCYYYGHGVSKNYSKAIELYTKASEDGNTYAQYNLGVCYYNGRGVTKDYTKAALLYTKAAEAGHAYAQYNLGSCYYHGRGIAEDRTKAVELYTKSAEAGCTAAQYNLGLCYYNGHGVAKDYVKTAELHTKAAESGNHYAQNSLGICYENGTGVTKDYTKALELYAMAANAGNSNAHYNLVKLSKERRDSTLLGRIKSTLFQS